MASRFIEHLTSRVDGVKTSGRWTPGRKACLLELIRRGALTADDACQRYGIDPDELASWQSRMASFGAEGLAINKLQELRT